MKYHVIFSLIICACLVRILPGQTFYGQPFTHTFSIVARDSVTGEMGVAVQSHWFSVGSIVSWAEAGIGAVATQSLVNVSFGQRGLDLLRSGKTAQQALNELLASDEGKDFRQLAIIDAHGNVAAFTGEKCIAFAGHITGKNFSVQANMMMRYTVWPAMAKAFQETQGPLAERMMAALKAAQEQEGDIRGQQSAAILVVKAKSSGKIWEDRLIDLRVEDHPKAVAEMERVLKVFRAYEHMNNGDLALEKNDVEGALREYETAESMFPENLEMKFWHAVALANIGKFRESLPLFGALFVKDVKWMQLTRRIVRNGLLKVNPGQLEEIMQQVP